MELFQTNLNHEFLFYRLQLKQNTLIHINGSRTVIAYIQCFTLYQLPTQDTLCSNTDNSPLLLNNYMDYL